MNGYLLCIERFLHEMENISYHLAAERIEKDILCRIVHSFLENESDFSEELKFDIFTSIEDMPVGFDEDNGLFGK